MIQDPKKKGVVPFAREVYKRVRASTPEQTLLNFIVEKDASGAAQEEAEVAMLLQRPGLTAYNTLPGPIQGLYATNNPAFDFQFAVAGNQLYNFDTVSSFPLGTVGGTTGMVSIAGNFDRIVVVNFPLVYCFGATKGNTSPSFRNISIPDINGTGAPKAVDVTHINGYFVIACDDGTFFWIVPGEDTIDPLNFATAESDPDGLVGVDVVHGNLVFFGRRTIETWQPTGNADLPFQRAVGQDYERGCMNRETIVHFDNSIVWVGEDGKVYRAGDVPKKISTDGIDERIRLRGAPADAWTFSFDGHLFYCLSIPAQGTFVYDAATETWSQFSTTEKNVWLPWVGTDALDTFICGDRNSGKIWTISANATDDGVAFPRRASGNVPLPNTPRRVDNIAIDVGADGDCTWQMRWADPGDLLADQPWVDLVCPSGSQILTYYRMGAARAPYRTIEVQVVDPVVVRLSGARVGGAWK